MKRRHSVLVRILAVVSFVTVAVLYVALIWDAFQNDGKPLTTLAPKGPNAQSIQNLVLPVFGIAGLVFVGVFGAVLFFAWRYREHDDDPGDLPDQLHGNPTLEIGWTILPALVLAGIAVFTVIGILKLEDRKPDALQVEVYGQQWWWNYKYDVNNDGNFDGPEDITTPNELVVPEGRQVELHIRSNDVIHSFWIPALNGKKDAVPGITNDWSIEADDVGVYRGQCTEFCGLSHANMRMVVRAVTTDDYETWVAHQLKHAQDPPADSEAAKGKETFGQLCATCHVINGQFEKAKEDRPPLVTGVAPNLTHLFTRGTFAGSILNLYSPGQYDDPSVPGDPLDRGLVGDPGNALYGGDSAPFTFNRPTLEAWLRNPQAMKPAYAEAQRGMPNLGLTEQQIDDLVAYLQTLK